MNHAFAELTVVETQSRAKVALQDWYNDSWEFRKNITLSLNTATGVNSDLTDFPVLISFTDTDLIQTGFVLVPDDQKSFPLVEETYEPEPIELEPVKEEKKGFFDWLFALFG